MKLDMLAKDISGINPLVIKLYLNSTGWNSVAVPKKQIALYNKVIEGETFEVLLPLTQGFADYHIGIYSALETVAKTENRTLKQVAEDLTLPPCDVIKYRISGSKTQDGTIPLLESFDLFESAKKALLSAACDILQPEFYHKKITLKSAQNFVEKCKFGQTDKGSFIASIICPFIDNTEVDRRQLSLFSTQEEYNLSFTRRVTSRIMKALSKVKSAIDDNNLKAILEPHDNIIISANFLEALLDVNSIYEDSEVEIFTTWSTLAPCPENIPVSVTFNNRYNVAIETIISKLIPTDEEVNSTFIGKVSSTKAHPDPNQRNQGEIIFNFIGEDDRTVKAKVILNGSEYSKACEAHIEGKTVRIKGRLISKGRLKLIEEPVFEVLD